MGYNRRGRWRVGHVLNDSASVSERCRISELVNAYLSGLDACEPAESDYDSERCSESMATVSNEPVISDLVQQSMNGD